MILDADAIKEIADILGRVDFLKQYDKVDTFHPAIFVQLQAFYEFIKEAGDEGLMVGLVNDSSLVALCDKLELVEVYEELKQRQNKDRRVGR